MKILVNSILGSLPKLIDVFLLLGFLFLLFGIIGVQLWAGSLRKRCTSIADGSFDPLSDVCGAGAECPSGSECVIQSKAENPNFGVTNFDNIGWGFLLVFQCLTLEGWTDIMYTYQRAEGPAVIIFFLSLVVLGAFFMLNLALAVVMTVFSELTVAQREIDEKEKIIRLRRQLAASSLMSPRSTAPHSRSRSTHQMSTHSRTQASGLTDSPTATTTPTTPTAPSTPKTPRRPAAIATPTTKTSTTSPTGSLPRATTSVNITTNSVTPRGNSPTTKTKPSLTISTQPTMAQLPASPSRSDTHTESPTLSELKTLELEEKILQRAQMKGGYIEKCYNLCVNKYFINLVMFVILLNTLFMAAEYEGMSREWENFLNIGNSVFTFFFVLELSLKLIGFGLTGYFSSVYNIFDFFVVFLSLLDVFAHSVKGLSVLRTFRVFRLLRLIRNWPSLQRLVKTMVASTDSILNFGLLLILFMFIFALIAMQFFAGKFLPDSQSPRSNFNTLLGAMLTLFQILTGENWNSVMYDSIHATSFVAAFFFVAVVVLANYLLFNLFLAIILDSFAEQQKSEWRRNIEKRMKEVQQKDEISKLIEREKGRVASFQSVDSSNHLVEIRSRPLRVFDRGNISESRHGLTLEHYFEERDRSFFVFSRKGVVRYYATLITTHSYFENLILCFIFFSSVTLAIDSPEIDPNSKLALSLKILDIVFIGVFAVEMILKMIANGLLLGKGAYFRSGWNAFDCFVVAISFVSIFADGQFSVFRAFRALRALRPLRVIKRAPALQLVTRALFKSIPSVGNVCLIASLFWVIFGILGLQLFRGKIGYCNDETIAEKISCHGTYLDQDGNITTREWVINEQNFDNIFNSLFTLFRVSTTEGWVDVMHSTVDISAPGLRPKKDNRPENAVFFVAFIIICSFFVLNLFVGVVVDSFNQIKSEMNRSAFLTQEQQDWVRAQKLLINFRPVRAYVPPSQNFIVMFCFKIVTHSRFTLFVMLAIMLNVLLLAAQHYPASQKFENFSDIANLFFNLFFALEMILKLIGLGVKTYFQENWNRFDFLVVTLSMIGQFSGQASWINLLRAVRIGRLLKLMHFMKGMWSLFKTILVSLPSLMNVGSLLLLLFFIYAVLGVSLFGSVVFQENINSNANFRNFPNALLLLFRSSTGEGWPSLMEDCQVKPPHCSESLGNCGSKVASFYFVSFVVVVSFVMLNLFIAVILENFEDIDGEDERSVRPEDYDRFMTIWSEYDPDSDESVPAGVLPELLSKLGPPLGLVGSVSEAIKLRIITTLDLKLIENRVYFSDLLLALTRRAYGNQPVAQQVNDAIVAMVARRAKKPVSANKFEQENRLSEMRVLTNFTPTHHQAAICLQRHWRSYAQRKRQQRENHAIVATSSA
eukprot:TRINITY_DN4846_c0_g1_i3.p1 TRINITY_DN4846_c0_g1~~TRINITY_DN4846_c0_g1_i3.p1  ORF type:complete len:1566 (-),score=403.70 TRINITY_DN4846_c0_g1_i3:850-5007(-)